MVIVGIVVAIGLTLAFTTFLGPYGAFLLIAILFGLVLSTHQRNKRIYEDLQKIKQKLGIEDEQMNMGNEDMGIEPEIIEEVEKTQLSDLDKQIEQELEEIYQKGQEDKK
jgi:hypothetical protein